MQLTKKPPVINCTKVKYSNHLRHNAGSLISRIEAAAEPFGEDSLQLFCDEVAENKNEVLMPSDITIDHLKQESNCMECHQGRASAVQVAEAVADKDPDVVDTEMSLPNIHNNAAGPTFYGTQCHGWRRICRTYLPRQVLSRH